VFHTLAVSVNPVETFSGFAFGGEEKRIEGMMADLRRCRAVFLLSLLLVQLVAASTEQVKSQKLVTYVSVPDDWSSRDL
jgi:hypothetical protein